MTPRGNRRFRRRAWGWQLNERSAGVLNRACLPSDIIAFVVFCRLLTSLVKEWISPSAWCRYRPPH